MKLHLFCLFAVFAAVLPSAIAAPDAPVRPLTNVHAHNDCEHTRPLFDALDNGFCSVEADIHLVDGKLLVAHDAKDVRPHRTLESLYLDPLRARARKNGGRIYKNGPVSIILLIDIKTNAAQTYPVLAKVLTRYKDILTEFTPKNKKPRAVTAILSGDRPSVATLSAEPVRYAAYDGRLEDIENHVSPNAMPLVSQDWEAVSTWKGDANTPLPDAERKHIESLVAKAHAEGYLMRFWGTPDNKATWQLMRDLKIDLINTDDLVGLRKFLTEKPTP